jgi:hypothetical protein
MQTVSVSGWSNGGYSSDPSNPDYGTHDWIAQHALDWLPPVEEQFILNRIAYYLYGTELPDNNVAPDHIGDTVKHHVYYFADGSLQENDSAVRAQEEYNLAVDFFKSGDLVNASKRLGVMAHYISDVAVFGHVMGNKTVWGNVTHHGDYEDHVETRTNNYTDEFNTFLTFDGALSNISAYNATLMLAYDTTFDVDGELTCVWMDRNYDWSNVTFRNRCGESLNLAVNLVADVLHTFYLDTKDSAHFIDVPFYYQEKKYYCGPATLQMVFDFYGENILQFEIAEAARTVGPPLYSTYTDEMRRAAHFSNISTSMGTEMPENITGYTARKLGYAAFERGGMTLDELKALIGQDFPIILLMKWIPEEQYGHYRVAVGYNQTHIFLHDPWNNIAWGGDYGGPNLAMNYTFFDEMWDYSGHWALFVSPWKITLDMPKIAYVDKSFTVIVNITYPCPSPFVTFEYPVSLCNATITVPLGLTLAEGENITKNLGDVQAGSTVQTFWTVDPVTSGDYSIIIWMEGKVSGFVGGKPDVGPSYEYQDRIGGYGSDFVEVMEDKDSPEIGIPVQEPPREGVMPDQNVTVLVNVTDVNSGVKNVTLLFSVNNGTTWENRTMNYNESTSLYEAAIPGQEAGTFVRFKIVAYDWAGNNATRDGTEPYCTYQVISEFPSGMILSLFMALTVATIICSKERILRKSTN